MPGQDIDEVEIENLLMTEDGRGIVLYNDGINFVIQSASPWTAPSSTAAGASEQLFPAASSMGWLKIHYISGSTYGATGATAYIPVYRNLDTNTA